LGFGAEFVPLYAAHPGVGRVALVEPDERLLTNVGERFGIADRFGSTAELLGTDAWDAVHVLAPVAHHASLAVGVLDSGRHCACAVPMATELDDLHRIVDAAARSSRVYMMMETSVYAREYFRAEEMLAGGELGEITFYRGGHVQNLDGFPEYWQGFPPMKYLTHALSPLLGLTGRTVRDVRCLGSGRLPRPSIGFDNPYPLETGLFRLDGDDDLIAEVTMSFFSTARSFYESFCVYGTRASLEWPQLDDEYPAEFRFTEEVASGRGRPVRVARVEPADRTDTLPPELAPFVRTATYQPPGRLLPVQTGGGHGGSHPHLVHEFVSSILEGRASAIDAVTAASWTAPGICAHDSAVHGGAVVEVPRFG